jgi:hypothetical protein
MSYCKNLKFTEEPDYDYMKDLFTRLAFKEGIDLYDNMYDWGVRGVTIKSFNYFYDFIDNQEQNPFDN